MQSFASVATARTAGRTYLTPAFAARRRLRPGPSPRGQGLRTPRACLQPALRSGIGAWANPYLALRRAASAQRRSFPYAEKDSVFGGRAYSQTWRSGERLPNPARLRRTVPSLRGKGSSAIGFG
jgi:hypothetical protein